jgi:hypothetical protein
MRKTLIYLIILLLPISSFALGPASVYFGLSTSSISTPESKFFPDEQKTSLTNKKISGFLGFRFSSLRFEGSIGYAPEIEIFLQDDIKVKNKFVNYSLSALYDFSLLPTLYPYLGANAGYSSSKDLGEGYYAGGIFGIDLRLADFLGIGMFYNIDYMPFLKEKRYNGRKIKADNPIFHNIGLVLKFGF